MTTPFFSIAIPTKARSFLVGSAIESALRQTFSDIEIIVADNDDGDATREVVSRFKDPRVRYCRTGNLSMPDNWEFACARARGEFLMLLEDKQALKFHALERIHGELEREKLECAKWLQDFLDDLGPATTLAREPCSAPVTRLASQEVLRRFVTEPLPQTNKVLPIGHLSAFSRSLRQRILSGPAGKLCPPVAPDYTIGLLALAHTDAILFLPEALAASTRRHSNGRCFAQKADVFKQFTKELGGRESIYYDCSPVKASTVPGVIYNDFLRLQRQLPKALNSYPLDLPNYFTMIHQAIVENRDDGVAMDEEFAALQEALRNQPAEIQAAAQALMNNGKSAGRRRLHSLFKDVRRKTGLLSLEASLKSQLRRATGRKQVGRFKTVLEYVEWEHARRTGAAD